MVRNISKYLNEYAHLLIVKAEELEILGAKVDKDLFDKAEQIRIVADIVDHSSIKPLTK